MNTHSRTASAAVAPILAVLVLAGCTGKEDVPPPKLLDTGWFGATTAAIDTASCDDAFVGSDPEDGAQGWYWRDRPQLTTGSDNQIAYGVSLQTADGVPVTPLEQQWSDSGLRFSLAWDGWLAPSTDYEMTMQDCVSTQVVSFRTSPLGRPLVDGPDTIEGKTFLLDLVGATWTEPAVLAQVISLYFNTPILIGVRYASADLIDILGAPGIADDLGNVLQDPLAPSWNFPLASFEDSPYLEIQTDAIVLQYRNGSDIIDIPVEGFLLQATFADDGTSIGGGVISGMADTRNVGTLLGDPDNEGALCDLASSVGVDCEACADGAPYCMRLVGRNLDGEVIPNLLLVERG